MQSSNRAASESAEKEFKSTTFEIKPGTEWDRVSKLCDFNPKVSDLTDMSHDMYQYLQLLSNYSLPVSDCAQHEGRLSYEIGNPAAQADGILIFLLNPISQVCSQHFYSTPKINVIICCLPTFYSTECHMDI